ncbi:hypothetical protein RJZ56_007872 [Blastomyces dermatitidis]|uniref:Histone deacetylase complex subunit SAP30 Sin3 binding domain-containing protein n=3 Tax=Blastomyces TaxID=229219 RepID=A0A179U8I3_BLAGS|nr:uncharacterized protein BDBG_00663 [Blastomyces gilchristii SLH14081]XP_045277812.1 uncharacterized protein BDCG_06359 [Blastomyces dermatitidis ER-3]EEQ91239.1 hypothetical protein BDCG_06359 [Blastomyces dermatitidis ER-3]EGE82587.1 hypothetical protein BDDG_05531 [Blastomyces dermatitidis ATCC 18188]OAT04033.1 hypothetical protein BDBG_00663 [Blastomyces gilchristii SLH14081]
MAPPRQRTATNPEDSRSEASSSTRERHPTSTKGRRQPNIAALGSSMSSRDMKIAAAVTAAGSHDAGTENSTEPVGINWSSMPLSVLHQYRHAYNLPCASAYSSQISSIILSQGIGLRSPTTIAARRAQLAARRKTVEDGSVSRSSKKDDITNNKSLDGDNSSSAPGMDLHRISTVRGQGKVTKDQLATAVRKHFNNVGLVEQDAIARFLYKVREEGKGHEFRLRFQP